MERDFQFLFQTPPLFSTIDEAYLDGVYAGLNFHSLLETQNLLPPPLNGTVYSSATQNNWEQLPNLCNSFNSPPVQPIPNVTTAEYLPLYPTPNPTPRKRKPKLSEKIRALKTLLPEDNRRMDMVTVLEETYKYIKALQEQVRVLQSMPSLTENGTSIGAYGTSVGDLGRPNKKMKVKSPTVAPTMVKSRECCVYCEEEVCLLKKHVERKALFHQMMLDSTKFYNFFD